MRKRLVIFCLALLLLSFAFLASGKTMSNKQLKNYASKDIIGEIRRAATKALMIRYKKEGRSAEDWETLMNSEQKDILKSAAVSPLSEVYLAGKTPDSSEKAKKRAKELEEKIRKSDNKYIREAAGRALGEYYAVFCLSEAKNYKVGQMKEILKGDEPEGIKNAAGEALKVFYAQKKDYEEIKKTYENSENTQMKNVLCSALHIRFSSPLQPELNSTKLKEMAEDENLPSWIRSAAGRAYGKKATDVSVSKLIKYAKKEENPFICRGAGEALSYSLLDSDMKKEELLEKIVSSAYYTPKPYRLALENALAVKFASQTG